MKFIGSQVEVGKRATYTHTHTHTQFGDLTCLVLAYLQRKLNLGSRIQQLTAWIKDVA